MTASSDDDRPPGAMGESGPSTTPSRPALSQLRDQVTGQKNYDSFLSSTSSVDMSNAPTPCNTYSAPDAFDASVPEGQEVLYDGAADASFQPSITGLSSTMSADPSFRSSQHLLPSTTDSSESFIPASRKSIPAPLLSLHCTDRSLSGFPTPMTDDTLLSADTPMTPFSDPLGTKSMPESDVVSSIGPGRRSQVDVDTQRLQQLGYDAVLGRDYTFWSSLCISTLNIGCLQGALFAIPGLYNYGGPIMILVAWPLSGLFCLFLTLALSELASAYPVSGAMASWTWKVARGGVGHERAWGWLMGGVVLGGHLANVILVTWEISRIITGTLGIAFDYDAQEWHLLLFFIAVLATCAVTGATAWGRSHHFWIASGIFGVAVWLILNFTLISGIARHPQGISSEFWNTSGWSNRGYVGLLGWQYTTIASGMDASAHMAEETRNPSRNVPNAMTGSVILSYLGGYITVILLLLAVDPASVDEARNSTFPAILILEKAINKPGAIAIASLLVVVLTIQVLAQLQASSRFVFSLARDNAMPFSKAIQWTNSSKQPVVAHFVVIMLCLPFATLTLAGATTLYSVLAVASSSLSYLGYVVPVVLYLLSKKDLQTEGRSSWSMRGLSKPFGMAGVTFGVAVIIVQMLPGRKPVTPSNMSYSSVLLAGTALVCFLTWKLYGSKHYSGPIRALTKWETGMEIDLQSALGASRSGQVLDSTDDTGRSRRLPSESSIKIDSYPGFENVTHTVTVESARTIRTLDRDSGYEIRHDVSRWTEDQSVDRLDDRGGNDRDNRV